MADIQDIVVIGGVSFNEYHIDAITTHLDSGIYNDLVMDSDMDVFMDFQKEHCINDLDELLEIEGGQEIYDEYIAGLEVMKIVEQAGGMDVVEAKLVELGKLDYSGEF